MRPARTALRSTLVGLLVIATAGALAACGADTSTATTTTAAPSTTAMGPATTAMGATTTTAAPATSPVGTWRLASYTQNGAPVPAATTRTSTLTIEPSGVLFATTGCNNVRGQATVSGNSITITLGPATLMACPEADVTAQEQAIITGMPQVTGWRLDAGNLLLTDASGVALFTYAPLPLTVEGSWQVAGINTGSAIETSALSENITMNFANGTVSGSTGCNSYSGTYTQDGDRLTIDAEVATTMMACEPDVAALEQQFLAALGKVTVIQRDGDLLALRDDQGAMQVVLRPAA